MQRSHILITGVYSGRCISDSVCGAIEADFAPCIAKDLIATTKEWKQEEEKAYHLWKSLAVPLLSSQEILENL